MRFDTREEYENYFAHLTRVLGLLISWYEKQENENFERSVIKGFISRVLTSVKALGMKYSYHPSHTLALDLHDSGYPHSLGIMEIENDAGEREKKLRQLPPATLLKEGMLNVMFKEKKEPADLLWQMATRVYYESLDPLSIIYSFTPGEFTVLDETKKELRFLFSWLCYDFTTNIPYVHLMVFDQDKIENGSGVHEYGVHQMQFLEVVRTNGSRIPDMLTLAASIDGALEAIHPKVLKRIKLGPILSNTYSEASLEAHPLLAVLRAYGGKEDVALIVRTEMLRSQSQTDTRTGFLKSFGPAKLREVFALNKADDECMEARATSVSRQIILPHHVIQHVDFSSGALERYAAAEIVPYNQDGILV